MSQPTDYNFNRYLAAKRSVDDRALNRYGWDALAQGIITLNPHDTLRVLEIGAGSGTMIQRIIEWGLIRRKAAYTALDVNEASLAEARERVAAMGDKANLLTIAFRAADITPFAADPANHNRYDLLIAHAVMDLLDVPAILPGLLSLIVEGGLLYLTINFDGATILEPAIDPDFDRQIESLYHRTMDERTINGKRSGDSHTGRHLFHQLRQAGATIAAAGSSDWVVFSGANGYPADEAYFLHFIIHTLEDALKNHPELDPTRFANWIAERHAQIERGELVYIAHQVDVLARRV